MGKFDGKVAFITGAARGQGRSHAVRLAEEGADIIAIDVCGPVASAPYAMASPDDLAETVKQVEALGRRIVATQADVRDYPALQAALDDGVESLGRLDIVCANAGMHSFGLATQLAEQTWQTVIDIDLTGVWHTAKAAIPHLVDGGRGGAMVLTSSTAGLRGVPGFSHYVSAKHGMVGLMKSLALEVAPHMIRVNSIHPTSVNTDMIMNEDTWKLGLPNLEHPTIDDFRQLCMATNALPIPWVEPADVSNAVLFLVSDDARYITGATLTVDAGAAIK